MRNLKHTALAVVSIALIGALAISQAAEITAANAKKIDPDEILDVSLSVSPDTSDIVSLGDNGEAEVITLTPEEAQEAAQSTELVDFREQVVEVYNDTTLERLKPFKPVSGYVITTTGGLNVRAEESLDSEILSSLTYGQMIDIIGESDEWYTIPFGEEEGGVGYVLKEYVTTSYEEAKAILLESVMYESGVVSVEGGALNVRSAAGTEGTQIIDQVSNGDSIIVLDRTDDGWLKVYYGSNYGVGYVMADYVDLGGMVSREKVAEDRINRIDEISKEGIFVVSASFVNCRKMPSAQAEVIKTFSNGEKCRIISEGSEWTKIAFGQSRTMGYVKSDYVMTKSAYDAMMKEKAEREAAAARAAAQSSSKNSQKSSPSKSSSGKKTSTTTQSNQNPAPSSKGQAIVNAAAKYIGVKYVYGGSSPSGFDCSGLVQYACRQAGISVNRTSRAQYSNGVAVSKSNLQPGDLVFFSKGGGISHVGIYAGGGQVIHSPRPGKSVCYIPLSTICGYSTYVGARRVY